MVLTLLVHIYCLASGILIRLKNSENNGNSTRLKYIGNRLLNCMDGCMPTCSNPMKC